MKYIVQITLNFNYYWGIHEFSIDGKNEKIYIAKEWLNAKPRDMNALPGCQGDHRGI